MLTNNYNLYYEVPTSIGSGGIALDHNFAELNTRSGPTTWTATNDPSSTSDSNHNFLRGSKWYNASTKILWMCVDATPGSAVWEIIGSPALTAILSGNPNLIKLPDDGTSLPTEVNGGLTYSSDCGGLLIGFDGSWQTLATQAWVTDNRPTLEQTLEKGSVIGTSCVLTFSDYAGTRPDVVDGGVLFDSTAGGLLLGCGFCWRPLATQEWVSAQDFGSGGTQNLASVLGQGSGTGVECILQFSDYNGTPDYNAHQVNGGIVFDRCNGGLLLGCNDTWLPLATQAWASANLSVTNNNTCYNCYPNQSVCNIYELPAPLHDILSCNNNTGGIPINFTDANGSEPFPNFGDLIFDSTCGSLRIGIPDIYSNPVWATLATQPWFLTSFPGLDCQYQLRDEISAISIDWCNRNLTDSYEVLALSWGPRVLVDQNNNTIISWFDNGSPGLSVWAPNSNTWLQGANGTADNTNTLTICYGLIVNIG